MLRHKFVINFLSISLFLVFSSASQLLVMGEGLWVGFDGREREREDVRNELGRIQC